MATQRPTLDTVAAAAGVSRMTVSNAYNRPDQLAVETRQRVLAAAAELGYPGPDPAAASLRLRRSGTVGVVLTERLPYAFADPGLVTILHGIATELSAAGNALLLVPGRGADGGSLVRHAIVDGLLLCALDERDPTVAAALERQVPVVTVGQPRLAGVPRVGTDNRRGAGLVARHLLDLGHRRFAVVTATSTDAADIPRPLFAERVAGFRDTAIAGGAAAADVTIVCAPENDRAAGRLAVAQLLALPKARQPTAIFAVTDILALGGLDAAAAAGVEVPTRLSIAGFDDVAAAASSTPPLTTVDHDLFAQGRGAARLVLRLIAGDAVRPPRSRMSLVTRASTGPAPDRRAATRRQDPSATG
jgi:DNA-binding LacI/PurR family transcriptional regulator